MAQIINTRIKNRFDLLEQWSKAGVELLPGEIALVKVPTGETYINPVTGEAEPKSALLMKVGENGADGKPKSFADLEWLSAKAADVFGWAKVQDPSTITVKYDAGTAEKPDIKSTTLANLFAKVETEAAALDEVQAAIANFFKSINQTGSGVVKKVEKDATDPTKINVTSAAVATADIDDKAITTVKIADANVTTEKIADGNITTAKIEDGAITDNKVASGIAASKIAHGNKTVDKEIEDIQQAIAGFKGGFSLTSTGSGVVKTVEYNANTGAFTVTSDAVATNDIADSAVVDGKIANNAVTTVKIKDAAVTDAKIVTVSASKVEVTPAQGTADAVMLPAKLQQLQTQITDINSAIAGGTHFRGELAAVPTNVRKVLKKDGDPEVAADYITVAPGDIVLVGDKEFICTAIDTTKESDEAKSATWQELGDLSRVGTLETLTGSLAADATTNEFVTHIEKDAKTNALKFKTARPTAANIAYSIEQSLAAKLADMDSLIAGKEDTHDHPYAADDHKHGNIENNGTIESEVVDKATGILVYDANNKIQRATADQTRAIIGAGTSSLELGTTATTAAAGNHEHTAYTGRIAAIEGDYARIGTVGTGADAKNYLFAGMKSGTSADSADNMIIFDCGGAI